MQVLKRAFCTGCILVLLYITGCSWNQPHAVDARSSAIVERITSTRLVQVQRTKYRISPSDKLEIKSIFHPAYSDVQQIRPDGYISMPILGDIMAAGKNPTELAQELKQRYAPYLTDPDFTVIMRSFAGLVAYIGGEVSHPQEFSMQPPRTLLQAVVLAGEVLPTASQTRVLLIRAQDEGNGPEVLTVDLKKIRQGKAADIMLKPYDVIYVPKSYITHVDIFVEQYINSIIPRSVSFPFFYKL